MTCCHCEEPITGTPVKDPSDPLGRKFCSEECLTSTAEGWAEGYYGYGVAT